MPMDDAVYQEASARLAQLIENAALSGVEEPDIAALATAGDDARPSVRMITVLAVEDRGIVFLASRSSGKGRQLEQNPRAALCFNWPVLKEQVIVEGAVQVESEEESERYWQRRAREGQMVAWAADQSEPSARKGEVKESVSAVRSELSAERVARHPDWLAYRIIPDRIEFWPTGWQRARERICYRLGETNGWEKILINP